MSKLAVLDSSAILAVFFNERGGERVIPVLQGALLSTVNLTEAHTRMIDYGVNPEVAWRQMQSVQCEVCFFTDDQARIAAELMPTTRPYGLSVGDRACLALAIQRKAAVYTTDSVWKNLSLGIQIEVIR